MGGGGGAEWNGVCGGAAPGIEGYVCGGDISLGGAGEYLGSTGPGVCVL